MQATVQSKMIVALSFPLAVVSALRSLACAASRMHKLAIPPVLCKMSRGHGTSQSWARKGF